jgi:5-methylcytosine-specific restriction endonuclease McrA
MGKKDIRKNFRDSVFKRDKWTCQVCKNKQDIEDLDAHHITDRSEMPNGGYVKENGITVCKKDCHFKVEWFHITEGEEWNDGLHPDDLYKIIGSSRELAETKSNEL